MTAPRQPPVTEEELDAAAAALVPKLDRLAAIELEEPYTFPTEPDVEHRATQATGYNKTDALGLTDSLEAKITHEFAPHWCALADDKRAKADPVIAILELYPGNAGRVELYLCSGHHANLLDSYRRRALESESPELHLAGRRILALNPRPLDVADVIASGGAPLENPPPST